MIVDIHTHTFPDHLAARAVRKLAEVAQVPTFSDGTCAGLRASMRRAGIDLSAIMPIATKPSQVRAINAWAAEVNAAYDDLACFGTLHPLQEDWAEEIDRLVADGIPGIKLHPDYQGFFVDDAAMVPVYRTLADAGLILLFHAGVDIGLPPPVHCPPDRLTRVLDAVPNLTVVAAHMGAYQQWEDVDRYLVGRDLYFDASYSLADMGPAALTQMARAHGVERILFGSDSPWTDQAAELAAFRALPMTQEEIAAILGGNARRLLEDQGPGTRGQGP